MKDNYTIAKEVLSGEWGNGAERREKLTAAGYSYADVQTIVNALVADRDAGKQEPAPEQKETNKTLEIDYDPEKYNGIIVNVLV